MSCLRYAPKRSICPEVREIPWHPHRSGQAFCQVLWNSDDQAAGIVVGNLACHSKTFLKPSPSTKSKRLSNQLVHRPISQPLSRAQNTVPSLTPSKRPKPMKMNDMAIATRQLQQS